MTARDLRRYCPLSDRSSSCSGKRWRGWASRPGPTTASSRSPAPSPTWRAPMTGHHPRERGHPVPESGSAKGRGVTLDSDECRGYRNNLTGGTPETTGQARRPASVLPARRPPVALGRGPAPLALEPRRLGRARRAGPLPRLGHHERLGHHARAGARSPPRGSAAGCASCPTPAAAVPRRRAGWPAARSSRCRCSSLSAGEPATSQETSTRVDEVFTCWPPGPPERDARNSSSASGTRSVGRDLEHAVSGMPEGNSRPALTWLPYRITLLPMTDLDTPAAPPARLRAGAARLFGRGRLRAAGRRRPPGAGPRSVPRGRRPERVVSRGAVARAPSISPGGSMCRCSRSTPASWPTRATSATPPTAATSARPSCGPASARWRAGAGSTPSSTAPTPTIWASIARGCGRRSEHRVRSPLAELGWSKAAVREASRALGLPTWDAPAAPCLSSRVVYGLAITPARLRQVEDGEAYLRALGVTGDLRVRHHGDRARIEVAPDQMARRARRVGGGRARSSAGSASRRWSSIPPATGEAGCWLSRRARPPDAAVRRDPDRR